MTRSNVYIKLTGGRKLLFVLGSTSSPGQRFIVEKFLTPLLALNDPSKELEWIETFADHVNELHTDASYRYVIDLEKKTVRFYEEHYNHKTGTFWKGKDLTEERYLPYVRSLNPPQTS
ncbi:penicillin-binding protein [Longitalea luteola]|uniref:penicillin-binding protein n=1 Tax=Longitalea luteola TaxID=2812563 RepID=UPI001A9751BB|nr:penicillin-binding protein [Longitalea luteola]